MLQELRRVIRWLDWRASAEDEWEHRRGAAAILDNAFDRGYMVETPELRAYWVDTNGNVRSSPSKVDDQLDS